MELVLLEIDSKEWNYMWEWLDKHPINEDIDQPTLALNEGEAWEYTGTLKNKGKYLHQLRHLKHPKTNMVISLTLNASKDMNEKQIRKTIKL